MTYRIRNLKSQDKVFTKNLVERSYKEIIVKLYGVWDQKVQDNYFEGLWQEDKLKGIVVNGVTVGVYLVELKENYLILKEILIDPKYQNRGYGTTVIKDLASKTIQMKKKMRLGVFKINRAFDLYNRIGFKKSGETETHYLMEYSV